MNEVNQLQQQQITLQNQASSGLSVVNPDDNPSVMAEVLNQQTSSSANSAYLSNITQLQSTASNSASAMNSLQTIISQASDLATQAASGLNTSTQLQADAVQVGSLIQQALQLANTKDANGNYLFSGTATDTQPFSATTDANGNITAVTYNGNTDTAQSDIGLNTTISAQVPGENNSGTGTEGLFADSRTNSDVFGDLISLQQNMLSGNVSDIANNNISALGNDENSVINQISANGVVQSALTAANTLATSRNTNLTTQISGETSADLAQTLTELSQTQTAFEAALESGQMVMNVSLLNFIA